MEFCITVQDLHSITPDRYLSAGGAKLNDISYQLARQFAIPVSGVYLSQPGGMFKLDEEETGLIISSLNAIPTPNLNAFIDAFKTLLDKDHVPVTFHSIGDIHTKNMSVVHVDRHWNPFRLAIRNDMTGFWDFQDLGKECPEAPNRVVTTSFPELDESLGKAQIVFHSMVKVRASFPIRIEGFPKTRACLLIYSLSAETRRRSDHGCRKRTCRLLACDCSIYVGRCNSYDC